MKYIIKISEPNSLIRHRASRFACYDNMPADVKDDLKESLLDEQGHVCCYCMKRIYKDNMKIEHWKPQSKYSDLELVYRNLLGACDGNEGEPLHLQCCDTHKGDLEMYLDPLYPACESSIRYSDNGTIFSDDERVSHNLTGVLNLNIQSLRNNRRSIIDAVLEYLVRKYPDRKWTKAIIHKEIGRWNNRDSEGKYKEYYGVALFRLNKLLKKAQGNKDEDI